MGQIFSKLASAIKNDVVSGLRGLHHNMSMSMEQLEDDIVDKRQAIIKQLDQAGQLNLQELYLSINCVPVDCKNLDQCRCTKMCDSEPVAHFEIPQIMTTLGSEAIKYIGSTDKQLPFTVYSGEIFAFTFYQKYRKRGRNKPMVYIDTTPNANGMYDGFIFNAPLLKSISIIAIFKDPRQLEQYNCCQELNDDNFSYLNDMIKTQLVQWKLVYYRNNSAQPDPNDQQYQEG